MRFSRQQMVDFAEASHDRNPLHRDDRYASRTPFGETVVFGMAAVLAALGTWANGRRFLIRSLKAEFKQPLFEGTDYSIDELESEQKVVIRLLDGAAVKLLIEFGWSAAAPRATTAASALRDTFEPRASAAEWSEPQAGQELRLSARGYSSDRPALDRLSQTLGDIANVLPPSQLDALLWSSYVVGMEMPGSRALFSECRIEFQDSVPDRFTAPDVVVSFDPRFGLATLAGTGDGLALVRLKAFVRPTRPPFEPQRIAELVGREQSLEGMVAVITGSGRGLGAALAVALAARGADLVVNARADDAELGAVAAAATELGVKAARSSADLLTPTGCDGLREVAAGTFGRVDYLVCSASGPIRKAAFGEVTAARLRSAVGDSVELVRGPFDALRSMLGTRATVVCISSEYAITPPAGFAQYAAAKSAVEGLARGLAAEFPALRFVVVRPRRLLTDQTNTSGLPQQLPGAAEVASDIVRALCALPSVPGVHVIG